MKKILSISVLALTFFFSHNVNATVFYSQNKPSQNFSDLTNWNTLPDGTGANPVIADLTNGLHTFLVQNANTVYIDQNITVAGLIVGQAPGTNAILEIKGGTNKTINVSSQIYVDANGFFRPDTQTNTHQINITGTSATLTNLRTFDLRRSATSLSNLTYTGTGVLTVAASSNMNLFGFNSTGGGTITTIGSLVIYNQLTLTSNSTLTGTANIQARANVNVNAGSTIIMNNGIFYLNDAIDQILTNDGSCRFYNFYLDNTFNTTTQIKTIVGEITVEENLIIFNDAIFAGISPVNLIRNLRIDNPTGWMGTGTITFTAPSSRSGTINTDQLGGSNITTLGTANVIIDGYISLQNTSFVYVNGDVTVTDGNRLILPQDCRFRQSPTNNKTFTLGNSADLYVRGSNNFPLGFLNYSLSPTSNTRYDGSVTQTVRGGQSYGGLILSNGVKNASGADIDVNGNLTLNNNTTFTLLASDLRIGGNVNANTAGGILDCRQTVYLDGIDNNQTLDKDVVYEFQNFIIENNAPTAIRTKRISNNIIVKNNFTCTNTGGNASNYLIVDVDGNTINGQNLATAPTLPANAFTIGEHVRFYTDGATAFNNMFNGAIPYFTTVSLSPLSMIAFDGASAQTIPALTYGTLYFGGNGAKNFIGNTTILGNLDGNRNGYVINDGGNTITINGNWDVGDFGGGYNRTNNMTGTIRFMGGNQNCSESKFGNIVFGGAGTKFLNFHIRSLCNITIQDNVLVKSSYDIYLGCNLNIVGTSKFQQSSGVFYMNGNANQSLTIASATTTFFNDFRIENLTRTVTFNSNIFIKGYFNMINGNTTLNISNTTLTIAGDFTTNASNSLNTTGSTIVFDGLGDQNIINGKAANIYNNITLKNSGEKRFNTNIFDINGNFSGEIGVTLTQNQRMLVAGNWSHIGSMSGSTNNQIYFDGANQTVTGSQFNSVNFAGTNTKTLGSNILVQGNLQIENGSTLDVSASNYKITINGNWYNDQGGSFNSRTGIVDFRGNNTDIYSGGNLANKAFAHVTMTLSSVGDYVQVRNRTAPDLTYDIKIKNSLTISKGQFRPNAHDLYLGGDLIVNELNGTYYGNNGNHNLVFTNGNLVKNWTPSSTDYYSDINIDAVGDTVKITRDVSLNSGRDFYVDNGVFKLNGKNFGFNGSGLSNINITGTNSTFFIDANATLNMNGNTGSSIINNGGRFKMVGTPSNYANVTSSSSFKYTQSNNTSVIEAQYYNVSNTRMQGFEIAGGKIDMINNFSNGTFNGHQNSGSSNSFLDIYSNGFISDVTIKNITFNETNATTPTNNIAHTGGITITLEEARGTAATPLREKDSPSGSASTGKILWTYVSSFFWDGGAGTNKWNDANNWSGDVVPNSNANVILDHTYIAAATAYTISIENAHASAKNITLVNNGAGKVTLNLNTKNLRVFGDLAIGTNYEVGQIGNTDTLFVSGSFTNNNGRYITSNAPLVFNGASGNYNISSNSTSAVGDFQNVLFTGAAIYTLSNPMEVEGNLIMKGSTMKIGDANNRLEIQGNITISDSANFIHSNGIVQVEGVGATQNLNFGGKQLHRLDLTGTSKKVLASSLSILSHIYFRATTDSLITNNIPLFIGGNLYNYKGLGAIKQGSNGSIIFDSEITQYVGVAGNGDLPIQLNTLIFRSTGTKIVNSNISLSGDLMVLLEKNSNYVIISSGYGIDGNTSNNQLIMQNGILRIDGTNNFPTNFENINLVGGEVRYECAGGIHQSVYNTTYFDLRLRTTGVGISNKEAIGNILVKNNLIMADAGSQLNMNCKSLEVQGGFNVNAAPEINWGTACKTTCGTGGTLIVGETINTLPNSITNYHNLHIQNNGVIISSLSKNINVEGNLLLSDAARMDLRTYTITNTCATSPNPTTFFLGNATDLRTSVISPSNAFPFGFGNYSIASTSLVEYQANGNQIVFTNNGALKYGILELEGGGTKTLDGKLKVEGDFDMNNNATLSDNTYDMEFSGNLVAFGSYAATNNYVTFNGLNQTIRVDHTSETINFNDVRFEGVGTKLFWEGETYNFNKKFKSASTVNLNFHTYNQNVSFAGDSILINGYIKHDGGNNNFRFTKNGVQVVDFGATNDIDHLEIKTNAQVSIINNGLNITGNGGNQNFVKIEANATLNLGSLTHNIGQQVFSILGTLQASNADIKFNNTGNQLIDAFSANNVTFTGSGTKNMNGIWRMNDINIDGGVNVAFNGQDTLVVRGNWLSTGGLNAGTGKNLVKMEINSNNNRTINPGNAVFTQLKLVKTGAFTSTIDMLGDLLIDDTLRIGSGAILNMNGKTLNLGFPYDGGTQDESLVVEKNAELNLNAGSTLLFDGAGSVDANIDVYGKISFIGSPSQNVTITRSNGGRRLDLDIIGGTIAARYYNISHLINHGLYLDPNSTIDPTNNFSDGAFSQINEGVGAQYLQIESDVTGINDIKNISFAINTPTIGTNFNVRRDRLDGGIVTFADEVGGALGTFEFEKEAVAAAVTGRIVWPLKTTTNWIGGNIAGVNNWFIAANWSNGVPTTSVTAIIGVRPFLPIIAIANGDTAKCKHLQLTANSASVTLTGGADLLVNGDVQLGTGNLSTSLIVQHATSDIIVNGSWTKTVNSYFVHGNSTVKFRAKTGSVSITHNDDDELEAFNNIEFNSVNTFNVFGNLNVNGSIIQTSGDIAPKTNNYNIWVAGNWLATGGNLINTVNGTVTLDGAAQTITNANFDNLTIAGSSCKTIVGTLEVNDLLDVIGCIQANAGSTIDMNGNVTINSSGSFNDGGQNHTFAGNTWTGTGSFPLNTGKITFDKLGGTQTINASKFNKLEFIGTSQIQQNGTILVTNNVTINNSINNYFTNTFLIDNTTGIGDFFLGANENIYVNGSDNFPRGFASYSIDATSNTRFNGTNAQAIRGGVRYGNLILTGISTKTIISGNIGIKGTLTITGSTLDASANNYNIAIAGNWNNNAGGSFIARNGTVTFNGTTTQAINPGDHIVDGTKSFFNVTIDNSAAQTLDVDLNGSDIYIGGTLNAIQGTFGLNGISSGWNAFINRSLTASGTGKFNTTGHYYLQGNVAGNLSITGNTSILNNITINGLATTNYILGSNLTVDGDFNLLSGNVNFNGFKALLGTDINDKVVIEGKMYLNAGSELSIGNQTSVTVQASGLFSAIGTAQYPALINRRYGTGDYNFNIQGTIAAQNYVFEGMSAQGIFVTSTGTIDNINNFSNGTFVNTVLGGVALRIENTQRFTTANGKRIENVKFSNNPGLGTVNVMKNLALTDSLEFYNSTGILTSETYENDPNNQIFWTGPRKMIWTGAKNTDWYDVKNWRASTGLVQIPDSTLDAEIPLVVNQPLINKSGAKTKNLSLASGAFLTVQTPNDTASDLIIYEELTFEGFITTSSSNDVIEARGGWSRVGSGNYSYGTGGKVIFAKKNGAISINNGGTGFYDIEVKATGGTVYLASNLLLKNNLTITNGSLDVTAANFLIEIGGAFVNNATFVERNGTVKFTSSLPISLNASTTNFYNLTMAGTGSINMLSNLTVKGILEVSKGTFNMATKILNIGDGVGIDILKLSGGKLISGVTAEVRMGNTSTVSISNGGSFELIGTSLSNRAKLTNQGGNSKYAFIVGAGGTFKSKFYTIEHLDKNGITFLSGSTLDLSNNLSYGTLKNGTVGGVYLDFNNSQDLTGSNQIEYVEFPTNPGGGAKNVKKSLNSGQVKFYYAFGAFQGEDYENDPFNRIFWGADMYWTGAVSSDWNNPLNWDPRLLINPTGLLPTLITNVYIQNMGISPILNGTSDGLTNALIVNTGATLTLANNYSMTVRDSVLIQGTLTILNGSNSTINVGGKWTSNSGTFNSGNSSIINLNGSKGIQTVNSGSAFCQFKVNNTFSTAEIRTQSPLDIDCDLVIQNGILSITDVSHEIFLSGNWINNRTPSLTGFKNTVGALVTLDGNTNTSITKASTNLERFTSLVIAKTGGAKVTLNSNIELSNNLTINNQAKIDLNSRTLDLKGNLINLNTVAATGIVNTSGTLLLSGTTTQSISHAGGLESVYNLTLNNPVAGTTLLLNTSLEVNNIFNQTDGIVTTGANILILKSSSIANYTGFGTSNFINGTLRRYIGSNTSTYAFPVAKGTAATDYFRMDIINGNLASTNYLTASVSAITEMALNRDAKLVLLDEGHTSNPYKNALGDVAIWSIVPDVQPTGGSYATSAYLTNFPMLSGLDSLFGILKRPDGSNSYADWTDGYSAGSSLPKHGTVGRMYNGGNGVATRYGWKSFSEFVVATADNPLPISLSYFIGKQEEGVNILQWSTLSEKDNDYFVIEKSFDGSRWSEFNTTNGAGTSFDEIQYSLVDSTPYTPTTYYRIKQVDYDGTYTYSHTISVKSELNKTASVYPNPTTDDKVFITLSSGSKISNLKITDMFGRTVSDYETHDIEGFGVLQIRFFKGLETGQYIINIELEDGTLEVLKFISI